MLFIPLINSNYYEIINNKLNYFLGSYTIFFVGFSKSRSFLILNSYFSCVRNLLLYLINKLRRLIKRFDIKHFKLFFWNGFTKLIVINMKMLDEITK